MCRTKPAFSSFLITSHVNKITIHSWTSLYDYTNAYKFIKRPFCNEYRLAAITNRNFTSEAAVVRSAVKSDTIGLLIRIYNEERVYRLIKYFNACWQLGSWFSWHERLTRLNWVTHACRSVAHHPSCSRCQTTKQTKHVRRPSYSNCRQRISSSLQLARSNSDHCQCCYVVSCHATARPGQQYSHGNLISIQQVNAPFKPTLHGEQTARSSTQTIAIQCSVFHSPRRMDAWSLINDHNAIVAIDHETRANANCNDEYRKNIWCIICDYNNTVNKSAWTARTSATAALQLSCYNTCIHTHIGHAYT